jgi:NDP-sugar pyrophosphorylase family protein
MQAIILAGGTGVRLRPYTTILPKPLMPIGEKAILEIVLMQLKAAGFKELVFTVGYLAELIEAYFGDGSKWKVKIKYSREKKPLGTVGPLTLIKGLAPNFLVMNGDVLCDLDYADLMCKHSRERNEVTICSYARKVKIDLGVLDFKQGQLKDYIEKPEYSFQVSMGIYGINRSMIKQMPKGKRKDLPNLVREQIKEGGKIGVYNFSGIWYDIGRIEDYQMAQNEFHDHYARFMGKKKKGEIT